MKYEQVKKMKATCSIISHDSLPINLTQYDIQASHNCYYVAHFMATEQFRQDLEIDKGRTTQLGAPRIFAAIANKVDAQLALAALDGKVGFATGRTQRDGRARTDGATGHFIHRDATEADTFVDLLDAHHVAGKTIALLAYLHIDWYLAIGHIRAVDA